MRTVFFLLLMVFTNSVLAQDHLDRSYSATSKKANMVEARQEIQNLINQQVTEDLAKQILGEEAFLKNRNLIMSRIVRSSGLYIPFQRPGQLETSPDGFKMTYEMKVNPTAFRQLLQQNGLLNENEAAPVLLPLIQVVDRIQLRSDRWWSQESQEVSPPLRKLSRTLESSLRTSFSRSGFYVVRPVNSSLGVSTPLALRSEKHGPEDLRLIGDWYGAPLAIDGILQISRPKEGSTAAARLDLRLQVIQVTDGRPIADVSRSFETDAGALEVVVDRKLREVSEAVANDLSSQVAEAWQKGAVGSSQIRLSLSPKLPLPEVEKLKQALMSSNLGLRTVRERLMTSSGFVFEVESPSSQEELTRRLNGFQFQGKTFEAQANENEIRVQIK